MKGGFVKFYIKNPLYVDANQVNGSYSTNASQYKRDLSAYVEKFTFEDTTEKDNLVMFEIKSDNAFDMAGDKDLVNGTIVAFQFGILGESQSPMHEARITSVPVNYADRVYVSVQCLDAGTTMKKNSVNTVWKNKTSSDIVKAICDKYQFNYMIEPTKQVHDSLPQGNKTDYDFLKELADQEAFQFYMRGKKLFFKHKDTAQSSVRTFTYGVDVIKFKPKLKEEEQDGGTNTVEGMSFDAMKGEMVTTKVDSTNEKAWSAMGKKLDDYTGGNTGVGVADVVRKVVMPPMIDSNDQTASNKAQSARKKGKKAHTGDLEVYPDPLMLSDCVVTVAGSAQRHSGNWYVTMAKHIIDASGKYTLDLSVEKDGGKEGNKDAPVANTTIGPKAQNGSTVIFAATANGATRNDNTYIRLDNR